MAQTGYNEGVADVAPSEDVPNDYQNVHASPEAFGAGIGQGLESLGQGAQTAGKFFGKVVADSASNDYQDFATKILHGDPNKSNPDGTPDTGYLGLKGKDALDARPTVQKQLDDYAKTVSGTLQTPEQQQDFENFSRRYRTGAIEKIGSHADTQASTWYQGVNTASAKLSMDHIANNPDNDDEVKHGVADLTNAYVKNAELNGAHPGDPQWMEAVAAGKRDGLQARLNAIAVKEPARALAILEKNRDIAGVQYDNLANQYRGRAKQAQGYSIGESAVKDTYANNPAVHLPTLSSAGARWGISTSYLVNTQRMETGGNPNQTSSTGAQGPFQFIGSTARQYGLKDPFNYEQSADAAAHLAADNSAKLTTSLGRAPTDQELYVAHNQGAAGAAKLIANPNARAGDLVGDQAIRVNGGDPNAPASTFVAMMSNKFVNAGPAATQNRKAQAYQTIMAIPDSEIEPDVRQHALTYINQQIAAQSIAEEQDAKAKSAARDQAVGQLTAQIIKGGGPDTISTIAQSVQNGTITGPEARELYTFATGAGGIEDPLSNGKGYTDAMSRLTLAPTDPNKLSDPMDLVKMRNDGLLTKKGYSDVLKTMQDLKKNPDQAGLTTTRSSQLRYYKSQMGIDQEQILPGMNPFKNQKGVDKFDHDFVPAVETAFAEWTKKGGDAMEFWNDRKKLDGIMDSVYPPSQRKADSLFANGESGPAVPPPPPPAGTDAKAWSRIMSAPPNKADGTPLPADQWAKVIGILRSDPSEKTQQYFDRRFGPSGYTAKDVLSRLPPAVKKAEAGAGVPVTGVEAMNAMGIRG